MLTDDDLRRELTAAFHQEADPVARTAATHPTSLFRQAVRRRRRRTAALAASAAAAAAAAVLATGTLSPAGPGITRAAGPGITRPAGPGITRPTGPGTTTGLLLAAAMTTAPPASAAASGMPPFYVVADHSQPVASVRDAATGQLLSTVPLPAGTDPKLTKVTAARDGRTFVLAAYSLSAGTRFYALRVTAGGQSAGLTPLAVPALPAREIANAIAVTPDGTRLAVASQNNGTAGTIELVTLATGAARTWTGSGEGLAWDLSWDASGQRLAYFWEGGASSSAGLWLLDTAAPGTALFSGQRILPQWVGPDEVQDALLSPDGRKIIASVIYNNPLTPAPSGAVVGGIVELSAATGQPLRTLLAERIASSGKGRPFITSCLLASVDGTGDHLLASCDQFGRLDRGRFTAIPGAAPHTAIAAAW